MAINLVKGQRINLEKSSGAKLTNFCIGVNWGGIETRVQKKKFLGLGSKTITEVQQIDLDLSCVMYDANGKMVDHLYSPLYEAEYLDKFNLPLGKLISTDEALIHTGDDQSGDDDGDDGLDNELIIVDLTKLNNNITRIFFFLNSADKEDFSQVPYTKIRMYEGTLDNIINIYAEYNIVSQPRYKGKKSLILGELYKKGEVWRFSAIGDALDNESLGETIEEIGNLYLK